MRTIYNGGFLPALAIDDSPESPSWGWLMAKNPLDGQWVTIANLSAQITAQTDDVIDAQIAALTANLEVAERKLRNIDSMAHSGLTFSTSDFCADNTEAKKVLRKHLEEILREVGHD